MTMRCSILTLGPASCCCHPLALSRATQSRPCDVVGSRKLTATMRNSEDALASLEQTLGFHQQLRVEALRQLAKASNFEWVKSCSLGQNVVSCEMLAWRERASCPGCGREEASHIAPRVVC